MVQVGFRGKYEFVFASSCHVCIHKGGVPASIGYIMCVDDAGSESFSWNVIILVILMAGCNKDHSHH